MEDPVNAFHRMALALVGVTAVSTSAALADVSISAAGSTALQPLVTAAA
jgi:ABC-type phosphate transport system substrate-binding protein